MPIDPRIKHLGSIEDEYSADALKRIAEARKRIAKIVHAAARDNGFKISGRNRDKLYALVDGEYAKLEIGLRNWSKDLISRGVDGGLRQAEADLVSALGKDAPSGLTRFSRQYAEEVFRIISPGNESQLAGVLTKKMTDADLSNLRKAHRDVFRQAALDGWSARRKEQELKNAWDLLAGGMDEAKFVDAGGKTWDTELYVNMLTRTTAARVWRDGYAEGLSKNGDDLMQIVNADGEACAVCQAWDGIIVSISGADTDFPGYQQAIDAGWAHPNCRCLCERVDSEYDADEIERQRREETPEDVSDVEAMQAYNDATVGD